MLSVPEQNPLQQHTDLFYAGALVSEAHRSEEWRSFVGENLQLVRQIINV